jgi:N-acetyl-gamma-glutamyl-phosphate reductase
MSMPKHSVAVLGASGYGGGELLRYLSGHPSLAVAWGTADSNAGKLLGEVAPHLLGLGDVRLEATDAAAVPDVDLAFLALPHGTAAETGRALAARGIKVVDFSADWRLRDPGAYEQWYGWAHAYPNELAGWVYGMPELYRSEIGAATRVANPGCYPSAITLALAPLLRAGVVTSAGIVVDAASGVSGAGKNVSADYLFTELDGSFKAYRVGNHQHTPEVEQELAIAADEDVRITFVPHLAPMARGILATCYAQMTSGVDAVRDALQTAYKGEPFVHVLETQPTTKQVAGTNHVLIGVGADERTNTVIVTSAIDNLGKGAAGQAIQNANLMLGLDETSGLQTTAVYP